MKTMNVKIGDNHGRFIKKCPGTPHHVCCGYNIIDFAHGCTLGCSYCILNYYFHGSTPILFRNREKLFEELERYLRNRKHLTRFGTGEFTDSLLFEHILPLYGDLIPRIESYRNAVLEIKTKTGNIDSLLNMKDHEKTILSWSMNSSSIAQSEERGAASISKRIDAAYKVQEKGYKLAFHFDPIIIHENWEKEYAKSIEIIFKRIKPENIVYVSLGTLRFIPGMKSDIKNLKANYLTGEFVKGLDNKMRYFRPLRTAIYRKIKSILSDNVEEDIVYLCMETPTVWEDVFGIPDMDTVKLTKRLDNACYLRIPALQQKD
jgi:spore photoproduct lyase